MSEEEPVKRPTLDSFSVRRLQSEELTEGELRRTEGLPDTEAEKIARIYGYASGVFKGIEERDADAVKKFEETVPETDLDTLERRRRDIADWLIGKADAAAEEIRHRAAEPPFQLDVSRPSLASRVTKRVFEVFQRGKST